MFTGGKIICLFLFIFAVLVWTGECRRFGYFKQVEDLVRQWAPLVWLAPEERYFPQSVDDFLKNVYVGDGGGKRVMPYLDDKISRYKSTDFNLLPYRSLESLQNDTTSFIFGNPDLNKVSVYAVVTHCATSLKRFENEVLDNGDKLYFHVTYWIFYPYNLGKDICVLGKVPALRIFNTCLGNVKTIGNHVGDWEHMSLSFVGKNVPDQLYLAAHTSGAFYTYNEQQRYFKLDEIEKKSVHLGKYPELIRTQGDHPVVFSAYGSHGMWGSPGVQEYVKVPKLTDMTGYGTPWKTWNNVKIYHIGHETLPSWMTFRGRWGNPKKSCLLIKKFGICEYSDGPTGIVRKKQDFYCFVNA
uniref:Vacuolar protein sorting-associated protein TDA6 isoform X1 n=1 Tax=Diabrotica virgifera virgifera TaxID=50390 RepID=A0A6P7GDX6_DIAVI